MDNVFSYVVDKEGLTIEVHGPVAVPDIPSASETISGTWYQVIIKSNSHDTFINVKRYLKLFQ